MDLEIAKTSLPWVLVGALFVEDRLRYYWEAVPGLVLAAGWSLFVLGAIAYLVATL